MPSDIGQRQRKPRHCFEVDADMVERRFSNGFGRGTFADAMIGRRVWYCPTPGWISDRFDEFDRGLGVVRADADMRRER